MTLPWNSSTKPALLITLVLAILIAFVWIQDDTSDVAQGEFWESSETTKLDEEARALDRSIDHTISSAERFSPTAVGSSGPVIRRSPPKEENPIQVAQRLVVELRQIMRAGRSMKSLRNSDNSVLRRRCLDGMGELGQWTNSVAERERRLALPPNVPPMRDVYTYAAICTSCRDDAAGYCDLADRALELVSAALGDG